MQTLLGHPLVSPTVGTHAGPPGLATAPQPASRPNERPKRCQQTEVGRPGLAQAPGRPVCSGHATHRDKACPQASSPWHSGPDAEGPRREGFLSCLFPSLQA